MNITLLQMNPGPDKAANIEQARGLLARLPSDVNAISLPEAWTCLGADPARKQAQSEILPAPGSDQPAGPAYSLLRDTARSHGIWVHGGSMFERTETDSTRLLNTTVVFDPTGQEVARYSKLHLFDIDTPDGTGYRESDTITPGEHLVTFEMGDMTAGLAICYDLRFPELFRALRDRGAQIIFLPAAFTLQTGKDHWEPLLRARAIETQCWFVAAGTFGPHPGPKGDTRYTYGHSLVVDPWGHIVACASDGIGLVSATLDAAQVASVRAGIPLQQHRRLPLTAA